ncbi:MAG TPA: helix-turn-helix domain-containing protein, partial [Candidatus Thermoplasmatota archaeon]|nr:helix-turn-helix domain-containing protein [Candidatus Thermoplasmatota archaeon]
TGARLTAEGILASRGAARAVFVSLPRVGGASVTEIGRRVGCSEQLAQHHLRALVEDGLVRQIDGRPRRYVRGP